MQTVNGLTALRNVIKDWKKNGQTIAFTPTMGNLHDGHLSLLEEARNLSDRSVVSIFVNPIQFGKGEDYESYPSTLQADQEKLKSAGLDLLFTPNLTELYPGGMDVDTRVNVPELSDILCGASRPGHFSGVVTVVSKLLINVMPDYALFGEKDYQQLKMIQRMVSDLCIPTEIIGMPIVREKDGLAMSSRNSYLSGEQRKIAPAIYKSLLSAVDKLKQGTGFTQVEREGFTELESAGLKPEYFSIRRTIDLGKAEPADKAVSILVAAWLGPARLIDNIKVVIER
jgi:pantoate--beta-alanine ligase